MRVKSVEGSSDNDPQASVYMGKRLARVVLAKDCYPVPFTYRWPGTRDVKIVARVLNDTFSLLKAAYIDYLAI